MINKQGNKEKALAAKAIAEKYNLSENAAALDDFVRTNDAYTAHILMIGGFSAGKSALLNTYIGKPLLAENIVPETDIATEIHFSENERIVAKFNDGTEKVITSKDEITINDVSHLEYYVNSENVKTQCDYIMVDTPGADSGIEKHNKALMQYLGYGTAFFVVVDCDKGTLSESTLRFIDEALNYSADIAIIINKCDKKIPEDIESVRKHIEELVLNSTGLALPIVCTSIHDVDAAEKIKELISKFNPQELYEKHVTAKLNMLLADLCDALETIKKSENCDTAELQTQIDEKEMAKKRFATQAEQDKINIRKKLSTAVGNIVYDVENKLRANVSGLAQAYKGGTELFNTKIMEIVRPVLISGIEEYSSKALGDFLRDLKFSMPNFADVSGQGNETDIAAKITEKLNHLYESGLFFAGTQKPEEQQNNNNKDNGKSVYRAITTSLAVLTSKINPVLELIIVFLPDILSIFGGGSREEDTEEKLHDAIKGQVIPEVTAKIRAELEKTVMPDIEAAMMGSLVDNINAVLENEENALQSLLSQKTAKEADYEAFITGIEQDIESVRK